MRRWGITCRALFEPTVETAEVVDQYTVKITYKLTYPTKLQDLVYLFLIPKEAMAELRRNLSAADRFSLSATRRVTRS